MRIRQWANEVGTDIRGAMRQAKTSPGFTLVVALTLALGIGANSAMFALADAALLRPLPFDDPERVVMLWERRPNGFRTMASPAESREWIARNRTFAAMAGLAAGTQALTTADGTVEEIPSQTVTARYFDVLRVTPVAGRTFVAADATASPNVVVIGEGLWRRRFGGDPVMVGRDIIVGGRPLTVIGIVPATFQMIPPFNAGAVATGAPTGLWVVAGEGSSRGAERAHYVHVIGRMKPDVTLEAAASDMSTVAAGIERESPSTNAGHGVALEPLRDALIGREVRLTALVLLGVVAFVLLMCCANVANLLLARANMRMRELAIRSALGAGRRRIAAQLMTESLVLAAFGGVIGVGVGAAILRIVPAVIPAGLLPNAVTLAFDARVAAFCAGAALTVGLLFGVAPAWQSTGVSLVHAVASAGRATRGGSRLRGLLVAGQVAAAVLVLSGAGLLLRTWMALGSVDPGHGASNLVTMTIGLPFPNPAAPSRYGTPDALRRYYDAVMREVQAQPGVRRVAWGSALPLDGWWFGQTFEIAGDAPRPQGERPGASYHMVSPGYFGTMAIPIVSGRAFTSDDTTSGTPVCVVSEAFVRQYLAGRQPLGLRVAVPLMAFGPTQVVERVIVGVARQVKGQPEEPRPQPQIYVPLAQNVWWSASLIVDPEAGPAAALIPAIRLALARVDKEQVPRQTRTLDSIAFAATSRPRFRAVLVATFAAIALVLAMIGVFGVLAYSVQQRTRESGVRIALGAGVRDVLHLVLASAVRVTFAGAAIGLIAAAVLTRFIATLLFGVTPLDPVTFSGTAALVVVAALVAATAPALSAIRVDPAVTFRND